MLALLVTWVQKIRRSRQKTPTAALLQHMAIWFCRPCARPAHNGICSPVQHRSDTIGTCPPRVWRLSNTCGGARFHSTLMIIAPRHANVSDAHSHRTGADLQQREPSIEFIFINRRQCQCRVSFARHAAEMWLLNVFVPCCHSSLH